VVYPRGTQHTIDITIEHGDYHEDEQDCAMISQLRVVDNKTLSTLFR
jgi:hypothetical protein